MPPLIGPALLAVGVTAEFAIPVIGTVQLASVLAYGITTVATIGAQFAFNRLSANRGRKRGDPQITAITIKQPIPVRTRAYGIVQLGGALFYEDAIPVVYERLIIGIVHCEGPVTQFLNYKLNDTYAGISAAVDTDPSGLNLALPWGTLVAVDGRRGTDSQAPVGQLAFLRGWTGKLNGLAHSCMVCAQPLGRPDKYFQFFFPNGIPTLKCIIATSKVYDPRDGGQTRGNEATWKFSRNPALIILNFLTYYKTDSKGRKIPRGMGLPRERINVDSFAAFASVCDQVYTTNYSVNPLDGSVGNTPVNEPRYRCDGAYQLDEAPTEVLNRLLATCDGTLFTGPDGLVNIRGGQWVAPTVQITDDMIISCDLSQGSGKFESFNRLKISFTATNMDYQVVEGEPWDDDADILENGVMAEDLSLPYVQSYAQSRRLAKIAMAKGNPQWHYNSLTCTLAALNCLGQEFVQVTHSLPGINGPFLVHSVKLRLDQGQVELQLSSIDPNCYSWNPATEDKAPPSLTGTVVAGGGGTAGGGTTGGGSTGGSSGGSSGG